MLLRKKSMVYKKVCQINTKCVRQISNSWERLRETGEGDDRE